MCTGHCSFFAMTEITAFSDRYEEFQKLNTEVLGVSIDSVVSWFIIIIPVSLYVCGCAAFYVDGFSCMSLYDRTFEYE